MVIDHTHPEYQERWRNLGNAKYNGCYYYSQEIVKNIIPRVKTTRDWNTVGRDMAGMKDGMIVFLHDNSMPWNYAWLKNYKDLILVCSSKYTADSVRYFGKTILLPMSIDTEYVKKFRTKKTKDTCFVGNSWVKNNIRRITDLNHVDSGSSIPGEVDFFSSIPREQMLKEVAKYKRAYAIDRCALECLVLGCELLPIDTRYHCDNVGKLVDNKEAAKILQEELNNIEGGK